jgi:nucleoside-diphosphate-sugar epimerase
VNEIAELVIELTNSASKIVHVDAVADDPKKRKPDISRAKELLGWAPSVSSLDGLKRTIEYFKRELDIRMLP